MSALDKAYLLLAFVVVWLVWSVLAGAVSAGVVVPFY